MAINASTARGRRLGRARRELTREKHFFEKTLAAIRRKSPGTRLTKAQLIELAARLPPQKTKVSPGLLAEYLLISRQLRKPKLSRLGVTRASAQRPGAKRVGGGKAGPKIPARRLLKKIREK